MKNLQVNFGKMMRLRGVSLVLAGSLALGSLVGCSSNDCAIPTPHAHMFVNEEGYVQYVVSEKDTLDGYKKSYNTRQLSEDEIKLYEFLAKKELLRIDENLDLILEQQEANQPFIAYEFFEYHFTRAGSSYRYYWTNNPEHENLTGKEKEVHYIYQAYKVEKNENRMYELIASDVVTAITEVMEEYPYMRASYSIAVDSHNVGVNLKDLVDLDELEMSKKDTEKVLKKSVN